MDQSQSSKSKYAVALPINDITTVFEDINHLLVKYKDLVSAIKDSKIHITPEIYTAISQMTDAVNSVTNDTSTLMTNFENTLKEELAKKTASSTEKEQEHTKEA